MTSGNKASSHTVITVRKQKLMPMLSSLSPFHLFLDTSPQGSAPTFSRSLLLMHTPR